MNDRFGIGLSQTGAITPADRNDPAAIRKAAKGIESLFLYELLKMMRESSRASDQGAFGSSAYTSMFDMELSRVLAERGTGLADVLIRSLERGEAEGSGRPAQLAGGADACRDGALRNSLKMLGTEREGD